MITNNLRFPGQYYDKEIKLSQNYFRDYAPSLGRYVQSDPIGLDGGINTFGYVKQNPLSYADNNGLLINWSCFFLGWFCPPKCTDQPSCGHCVICCNASDLTGADSKNGVLGQCHRSCLEKSLFGKDKSWGDCGNKTACDIDSNNNIG